MNQWIKVIENDIWSPAVNKKSFTLEFGVSFDMQFHYLAVKVDPQWALVKTDPTFTTEKNLVNTSWLQNKFSRNWKFKCFQIQSINCSKIIVIIIYWKVKFICLNIFKALYIKMLRKTGKCLFETPKIP